MDTKKTVKKKLRNGPVIEISQQILNWRKKRAKMQLEAMKQKSIKKVEEAFKAPESPTETKKGTQGREALSEYLKSNLEPLAPVKNDPWGMFNK